MCGLAVLVGLAGCGSAGPRPGLAVEVGDRTVTTDEVDRMTQELCTALQEAPESGLTSAPMRAIRERVVAALAVRTAAEQFAEDEGVTPGESYTTAVSEARAEMAGLPREAQEVLLTVDPDLVDAYIGSVTSLVGADRFVAWLDDHPFRLNPAYGLEFSGEGGFERLEGLSVAVSDAATESRATATLPAAQRCDG